MENLSKLNYNKVTTNLSGNIEYTLNGRLHRLDGPAIIVKNGTQAWYQNGLCHRDDGPAIIDANGTQEWYQNGRRHNEYGPAIIYANGYQYWYQNGKLHNEYGPAVIYKNGTQYWFKNDLRHREDGPALISENGNQYWYKFGIRLSSPNDNPTFLTNDDEFSLYYYNKLFYAGCRKFTKQQAINHWSNPREDNKNRAQLFLTAIENFKE